MPRAGFEPATNGDITRTSSFFYLNSVMALASINSVHYKEQTLKKLLGAYDYFLFFLYLFGSSTLEFRLYFRLFFISPLSLCSSRPLPKLWYKHFAFGTRFSSIEREELANGIVNYPDNEHEFRSLLFVEC